MSLNEPINMLLMEGHVEDSGSRKLRDILGYGGVGTPPMRVHMEACVMRLCSWNIKY